MCYNNIKKNKETRYLFEQTVDIERIEQIINLFGNFDENIKRIEKKYRVSITSHGARFGFAEMLRML